MPKAAAFFAKTAKVAAGIGVAAGVAAGGLFAAQEPVTKAVCAGLDQAMELDADHCIKAVAVKMLNVEMCDKIKGERFAAEIDGKKIQIENPPKMECITAIAAATNNPSLCDKVEGALVANTKIDCLYRVASQNRNPGACAGIGSDTQSRAGSQMTKAGCIAMVGRMPDGSSAPTPTPNANEEETERCQTAGGTGYNATAKQCMCPAGASWQGQGDTGHCACEIKPTGLIHSLFGLGSSKWHTLRPGEECGWWTAGFGIGQNLGKNHKECYAGGGMNYDPAEATCKCPYPANWSDDHKACMCNGSKLKEGGTCEVRE